MQYGSLNSLGITLKDILPQYLFRDFHLPEWLTWEVEKLRLTFIGLMITKDVWKICLSLINIDLAKLWTVPPLEYQIPQDGWKRESWKIEVATAVDDSRNKMLIACYEIVLNMTKFFTPYYPYLWNQAMFYGRKTALQITLFLVADFCLHKGVHLAVKYALMYSYNLEFKVTTITGFAGLVARIIVAHLAHIMFALTDTKWFVIGFMLFRVHDIAIYRLNMLPKETFNDDTMNVRGRNEIKELATNNRFPLEEILLNTMSDALPRATYYNFFIQKRIVVTKTLLDSLEPSLAMTLVAHEMCRWNKGHGYVQNVCEVLKNGALVYLCELVYHEPSFAGFFNFQDVHPIIPSTLVFTVVWPVLEEVANGLAGFVLTYRTLGCDDCASQMIYPTALLEALVQLAPVQSFQKFNSLYSSWFYGEPSLIQRIRRITKRT